MSHEGTGTILRCIDIPATNHANVPLVSLCFDIHLTIELIGNITAVVTIVYTNSYVQRETNLYIYI